MIGPAYARKYPQHVLTLGLYSTAAFRTEDDSAKVKGVVAAMRDEGHSAGARSPEGPLVHAGIRRAPPGRDRRGACSR